MERKSPIVSRDRIMRSRAEQKASEREARKSKGMKRLDVWLTREELEEVDYRVSRGDGNNRQDALVSCLRVLCGIEPK